MKVEITRCPYCGSKKLHLSSLHSQIWFETRTNTKGKMTKPKRKEYEYGELHHVLSCEDCDFVEEENGLEFQVNEKGHLCIETDNYNGSTLEYIKKLWGEIV